MRYQLLFQLLILAQLLSAQNFTEVAQPLFGVWTGSVDFSDVDGDGDNDLLITGRDFWDLNQIAKLYTNDGGNFIEVMGTPFEGVRDSSVAFSDVDGDGDEDLVITGQTSLFEPIAKLYNNDGGSFTEVTGTPFEGVRLGAVAFSDVDGDGDEDLLITGNNNLEEPTAKLYTNIGGSFIEVIDTPFESVFFSSVTFSDIDGDGDEDLLITGSSSSAIHSTKLYANDGGVFTEVMNTPLNDVSRGAVAFSDVDNDGDKDLIITGQSNLGFFETITKLYTNDGGNFTEVTGTSFDEVLVGSVAFSDVDGDGDEDLLITGNNDLNEPTAKLYTNIGGSFTEVMGTPFQGVEFSSVAFSDVDNDGDEDLLITGIGTLNSEQAYAKLYINGLLSSTGNPAGSTDRDFTVYPNPASSNTLYLTFESLEYGSINVSIYDMEGRLVVQQQNPVEIGAQTIPIDIESLTAGNYIIQLDDGKRKASRKVSVK